MKKVTMLFWVVFMATFTGVSAQITSIITWPIPSQTTATIAVVPVGTAGTSGQFSILYVKNTTNDTLTTPFFGGQVGDTSYFLLEGLSANTKYFYFVELAQTIPIRSAGNLFETTVCGFTPSFTLNPISSCETELVANSAVGVVSYQWKKGGNNITGATSQTYRTTVGAYYSVTESDGICTLTSPQIPVVITGLQITISDPTTVCKGSSTQLNASGGDTYKWNPVTGLSNPNIPNPVATPLTTTDYTVLVVSGNCSGSASVKITVGSLPTVSLDVSKSIVCRDGLHNTVQLTGNPAGGSYSGNYVAGNIFYSGESEPGIHNVSYTYTSSSNNCPNTATANITVTVPVRVDSTHNMSTTKTFKVFGDIPADGIEMYVYRLDKTYTPLSQKRTEATFGGVEIFDGDLLSFKSIADPECYTETIFRYGLGVDEKYANLHIYPNPFLEFLNVEIPNGDYKVSLVNIFGQSVQKINSKGDFVISGADLKPGMYFLRFIDSEGYSFTRKIQKE